MIGFFPVRESIVCHIKTIIFYEKEETINTVIVLRVGYNRRNWKEILLKK